MAVVRVLTAAGFSSDDLFGPVDVIPQQIGSGGGSVIGGFAAYGRAGVRQLSYEGSPPVTDFNAYSGAITSIVASDYTNNLASVVFTNPVPVNWEDTDGWFFNHDLLRSADPNVPSIRFAGSDDMQGNDGADIFFGYGGADNLRGLDGNDRLIGGAGDDRLEGGADTDDLIGGAGDDTFVFKAAESSFTDRIFGGEGNRAIGPGEINSLLVTGAYDFTSCNISQIQKVRFAAASSSATFEAAIVRPGGLSPSLILDGANGNQAVNFNRSFGGTTNLSQFTFINWDAADTLRLAGSPGNDVLTGSSLADVIVGNDLDDVLIGGPGADTLDGGAGNDLFALIDEGNFVNTLADASGYDTVTTTITRAISPWGFIEALTLVQGAGDIWGFGNGLNNSMVGNSDNNRIEGFNGNDAIAGMQGCDTLVGGDGDDAFRFFTTLDSAAGSLRDVITDLNDFGNDVVDLSPIAGVTTYIGQAAFNAAGQVRAVQSGAHVLIQINTVGVSGAESEILLLDTTLGDGAGQFSAGDLLL